MVELKPCPFCGGKAQVAPDEIGSGGQHVPPYHAGCFCGGGCGFVFTADDPDEAAASWNRRTLSTITPAEVGGLVERLRGIDEAAMYERPATTRATIERSATALEAQAAELSAARAEIERMTPNFVAYEYLESPAGREIAEATLTSERASHAKTKRERDEAEAQRDEALKDVVWLLDAFQDEREAFRGRELRDGDLPPEWHRAARRVREGGKADG